MLKQIVKKRKFPFETLSPFGPDIFVYINAPRLLYRNNNTITGKIEIKKQTILIPLFIVNVSITKLRFFEIYE